MRWAFALLLLVGCDRVFALTHVNGSADAGGDGVVRDDTGGSMPCAPTTSHDEDGDGLVDNCDSCPTVASKGSIDSDGDGLDDPCDPNLSTSVDGDKILLASTFASTTDLSDHYTQSGGTNPIVSGDTLVLMSTANATTIPLITPTKIVALVSQFTETSGNPQIADKLTFGANGVTCSVSASGCNSELGKICISLGTPETKNVPASEIVSVSLWRESTGTTHCEVATRTMGSVSSTSTGTFTSSNGFVRVESFARAVLTSLVFYGEK